MKSKNKGLARIFRNNLLFFYTSAFNSGIQNIVTQMFYQDNYPEKKEILMPLTLLIGAIATVLGIFISNRNSKLSKTFLFVMVGTLILSFSSLFIVTNIIFYILFFSISSFLINYIFNTFDRYLAKTVSNENREKNVKILLSYQMVAYIVSPLFFSSCAQYRWLCIAFVVIAGILSYSGIIYEYMHSSSNIEAVAKSKKNILTTPLDLRVLGFCFCMFTGVYMLISSVAYLFKDYMKYSNYAFKSSLFLGLIVLISAMVIAFMPSTNKAKRMILAPVAVIISICILLQKNGNAYLMIFTALLCGIGYGFFLRDGKHYVNFASAERNMVGRYNAMMTSASLTAYALSAVIGGISTAYNLDVVLFKFSSTILFFVIAILLIAIPVKNQ